MTSDIGSNGQRSDLRGEAQRWVVRLHSGRVSQADVEALMRWRDESPAHRRALAEANAQWDVLRVAARNVIGETDRQTAAVESAAAPRRFSRRAWLGSAMAASIGGAVYLAARPPLDLWPSLTELTADFRTDVGERRQLVFASAASVEMNTRTSLAAVGSGPASHQIELIAGEIAVTTGQGSGVPSEPFVVVAGNGRASAARAIFDLRHDGQTVTVTCLEGEVKVECKSDMVLLGARQQIGYGQRGFGNVATTDARIIEAWRQGLLVFDNQPLAQVIPEINRYRRGRIILTNDDIGRLPLDATFRLDRIDEVVPKIAHIFDLKITSLPGGVVLLS